jgi:hypothetical protein
LAAVGRNSCHCIGLQRFCLDAPQFHWFEDSDDIEALEELDTDSFADRQRVGYRFSVDNPEGHFLVEQQAYLSERDGRIVWMRVLCSGYRPVQSAQ